MAYDEKEIIAKALKLIPEEDVTDITDLCLVLGVSRQWFYVKGLDKNDEIKEAIETTKRRLMRQLRRKWRQSDNATLQIAEARLLSTDDELERLTISKVKSDNNHTIKMPTVLEVAIHEGTGTGNEIIPG
jgi:poly-D-alanine transfer protein DltD